jgi:L-lactate dehydrogenase complex protein LldG
MNAREDILARIRANQPAPTALPVMPPFGTRAGATLVEQFSAGVARMGGKVIESGDALASIVHDLHPDAKVVVSAMAEHVGTRYLVARESPASLEDVDVGIVRARFGVAETGSVWITDADFVVSALGFLAQHLIVLLDPAQIVPDMHHAYSKRDEFQAGYGVFMTGPSATADIEGILIHGAQGIRSLVVLLRAP